MKWQFTDDKPIYSQIVERIGTAVASGELSCGERLPSVRDMAAGAGVNPNTMQRALADLERAELVYSDRTAGRFITSDEELVKRVRNELAEQKARSFLTGMHLLRLPAENAVELLKALIDEENSAHTPPELQRPSDIGQAPREEIER